MRKQSRRVVLEVKLQRDCFTMSAIVSGETFLKAFGFAAKNGGMNVIRAVSLSSLSSLSSLFLLFYNPSNWVRISLTRCNQCCIRISFPFFTTSTWVWATLKHCIQLRVGTTIRLCRFITRQFTSLIRLLYAIFLRRFNFTPSSLFCSSATGLSTTKTILEPKAPP